MINLEHRKKMIFGAIPCKAEPITNSASEISKARLLVIFSPTLVQMGMEMDIPSKKIATIQPMNWIPCRDATIAGIAVLIIVPSSPDITLPSINAMVTIVTCFLFIQTPLNFKIKTLDKSSSNVFG